MSDNVAAQRLDNSRTILFNTIFKRSKTAALTGFQNRPAQTHSYVVNYWHA